MEDRFVQLIAQEAGCRPAQVRAASELFAEGATVPFVARYRKEVTGGLDDAALETVAKRREYFLDLTARRDAILESIASQDRLTEELEATIRAAVTKQELEDLYLPYKPKRRTRAQMARERGLEPLADALLEAARGATRPEELARAYVRPDPEDDKLAVLDEDAALAGARDILAERLAEDAGQRTRLRRTLSRQGVLSVRGVPGKEEEGLVYRDWFEHQEPLSTIASHRLLAVLRGEREGLLLTDVRIDDRAAIDDLARSWRVPLDTPCGRQIAEATADGYKRLLRPSLTHEVRSEAVTRAESEAIAVFRANLEALLMQAPLGQVPVMGVDPGLRTGSKVTVVDGTGRVVATEVVYPLPPREDPAAATALVRLAKTHGVHAVAVGNGTGGRETEAFVRQTLRAAGLERVIVAIVPETGASVYSASTVARDELPDLDVSLRGAVSIARRLQDPLAELVKIDPKSMGVGQYQHDVDQKALAQELDLAVEGVVNRVGVELNTASPSLLRRVSGLSERLARAIVERRDAEGPYRSRAALLEVAGLGPKTFELSAGFLRLREGSNPLDRTAVHPERYPVVERMTAALGVSLGELVGSHELVGRLDFSRFADAERGLGEYTLQDIRDELLKPGRDPRPDFDTPEWREDVTTIDDLEPGMVLEGRVSNVTNFGAFVDLGVKRDGLVHISELSHEWVEDPRRVIHVGQIVTVQVIEVDRQRQRVALSIKRLQEPTSRARSGGGSGRGSGRGTSAAARLLLLLLPLLLSLATPARTQESLEQQPAPEPAPEPAHAAAVLGAPASTAKWLLFPSDPLYRPYLGDPHRIAFAMEWLSAASGIAATGSSRFVLRVGGDFGLLRRRPRDPRGRVWQVNFLGSLDAQFDVGESLDNVGWDGNFGTSVRTARADSPWSFRLGLFHTSAHRGDEYIERTGLGRIGYTREEVQVGAQRAFGGRWRGYLETGWGFTNNADDGSQEPLRAQTGVVYEAPGSLWNGRMGWYWGLDLAGWEERDWQLDSGFQIGLSLPSSGNTWRAALSIADGRPPMGEFFQDSETWASVGIWLDL